MERLLELLCLLLGRLPTALFPLLSSLEGGEEPGRSLSLLWELCCLVCLGVLLLRSVDTGLSAGICILDLFSILWQASSVDPGPLLHLGLEKEGLIGVIFCYPASEIPSMFRTFTTS